jgi:hypothetical protein
MVFEELQPTFICGHRKSGTTLLSSLLDWHPELLVYPDDSKFFQYYYPEKFLGNHWLPQSRKYDVEKCIQYTEHITRKNGAYFDFNDFKKRVLEDIENESRDWPDVLNEMIKAFYFVTTQPKEKMKRWVEKTTSSEIFALDIKKHFPEAKFIHIVRDPRDNYASLKSGYESKYKNFPDSKTERDLIQSCIERGRLGMEMSLYNKSVLEKDYLVIQYETLAEFPFDSLCQIYKFLGIKKELSFRPTLCGLPWKGNNLEGKEFDRVSSEQIGRWRDRITVKEAALLEFHFRYFMDLLAYKREFTYEETVKAASDHYKWLNAKRIKNEI